jgi:hypothetical protein
MKIWREGEAGPIVVFANSGGKRPLPQPQKRPGYFNALEIYTSRADASGLKQSPARVSHIPDPNAALDPRNRRVDSERMIIDTVLGAMSEDADANPPSPFALDREKVVKVELVATNPLCTSCFVTCARFPFELPKRTEIHFREIRSPTAELSLQQPQQPADHRGQG